MGIPGQYTHERMRAAFETVARAAKGHGKAMGGGGVRQDFEFQSWLLRLGVRYLARAAKEATSTIPIVVVGMADPVGDELIVSLARPGGNITGNTFLGPELIGKRFGLLKEAIPRLSRVVVL